MAGDLPTPKLSDTESLSSYFEQSAATVQNYTGRFERKYARPAINTFSTLLGERPIVGLFVSIFIVLSIFPIISIIAIALFGILSFVVTALIGVLIATTSLLILLLSFLTIVLIAVFVFTAFLTVAALATLVFLRFILLVGRLGLKTGLFTLYDEVKVKFFTIPTNEDTEGKEK